MTIKLSAALPKEDTDHNGLEAVYNHFITKPKRGILVVGVLVVQSIETDVQSGYRTPKVRFDKIEACAPGADELTVQEILDLTFVHRTGRQPLPLEMIK